MMEPTPFGKDTVLLILRKKKREFSKEATEANEQGHHEVAAKVLEVVDALNASIIALEKAHQWSPAKTDYYNL